MRKLGLLIDSDSQYFGTRAIAGHFLGVGWQVDYIVPELKAFPEALVKELKANHSLVEASLDQFCFSDEIASFAAVGCYSRGSQIRRFQRNVAYHHQVTGSRPYIFSGYNGVVYEKYEEGIFWRCGYDSICVNGPRDVDLFTAILAGTIARDQKLIPLGLNKPAHDGSGDAKRKNVVFAEQVIVPGTVDERKRLFQALSDFADANRDWEIVVRPRVPAGSQTFHDHVLHPEDFRGWPENVRISHDPLPDLMKQAQALLSVSSTAYFDAIAFGITPLCIMDFGVNAAHGTHYFVGCGTEMTLRDCKAVETLFGMEVCPDWLSRTGYNMNGYSRLLEDIEAWSVRQLPPAFPEEILNTTRNGRIAATTSPEEVMLLERARRLLAEGELARLARLIEEERAWFVSDPYAAYLAAECYEALGQWRTALRWLGRVHKLKPKWKKTRWKTLAVAWKWLRGPEA
ncbi:hypothetical protein FIV00_28025 [Labrenzia sp. THAF82]|uniref:DUF6716 putative glycosyltransferase n=1 Tax=Labrenzia sp. THAF82 TaxID=2587861 RepID=UPI001268E7A1|nr:DUF6716 putative glycosyltransferase [Labrenzia sp. THAF82]QFT34375.1 hypothetical protein FIV00_28025 [Labrenzia sp. THAF82]